MRENLVVMKKILLFVAMAAVCASCGPHKPSVAEQRAEKRQKDSLSMVQYARTVVYTDSLLQTVLPQADELLKSFRYVKNEKYADHGYYIQPVLETAGAGQRIYLQAYVMDAVTGSTDGAPAYKTVVRSFYYGQKLNHKGLTVSADSVSNSFHGNLHAYDAEGQHEILTLTDADAVALLQFVSAYASAKITVKLEGDRTYSYVLKDKDKAALVETLRLQTLMSDIRQLEAQHKQASLQYEKYARRLDK